MKELIRLYPYLLKYKNKLLLGFLFVTISNLASTYVPRIVGGAIDTISSGNFTMENLTTEIGKILILVFFSGFFMFWTRRTIIVASREIEYDLRHDMFDSIKVQSSTFFHKNPTGNLMAYATNDIPAAREFLGPAIMYSANTITTFSFALYFMFSLDPMIAIVGLLPLPIVAYVTYLIGKKIHIAFKDVQAQFAGLTTQAQESISGVRVIRAYTREAFENLRFAKLSREYLLKNLRLARLEAIMMPVLMVLVGLSQLGVLAYGGYQVIKGSATLGELTQFFIYLELLIWPVAAIGWITNLVQRGSASASRLGGLMEQKSTIFDDVETDTESLIPEGNIEFQNVSLKYGDGLPYALKNVSFKIDAGMTLGIVGSVGSGKTSLVNLITRLFDVTEGDILIDGKKIKSYSIESLRSVVGFVPQSSFLFSDTIENNLRFGNQNASMDDIIDASRKCKLIEEVKTFKDEFQTMLGERGVTLSGGQRQRVSIARALLKDPKILILDDSLSAVDTGTEDFVLRELKEFMKNRTTIIISHRLSSVKNADKIIVLDLGGVAEEGTHEELIALNGKYAEINKLQQIAEELDEF
ncbi:MAG: ABC transporter ATP-binding protein [Candidatus Kapabacteria bacterium]|nr:ABC transporter ATP-binding protein [Ignavibacteriota bacterium]MCW5884731.1 ABC transporter ATP-binding protein [Candidatus Kapabacteria bacterium]